MLKKDRVIVLRQIKHGEADVILHTINRQGARLSFFAKGGLKSRKRFAGGVLEPTHYVEVSYKEKPDIQDNPLHTLLEAQLLQGFDGLRLQYDRLQVALYFLRVMSKVTKEGAVDSQDMFDLLGNALRAAETTTDIQRLKLHFEVKVLGFQGVLPPSSQTEEWMRWPLKEHLQLEVNKSDLYQLESTIHHSLESYLF